jgi:divalent metal cation (Fe/Co/Zn/Cd) transporter
LIGGFGNATLITGAITAIVNLSGIPLPIDSAIAVAMALYILHIGIDVFCEWAAPQPTPPFP